MVMYFSIVCTVLLLHYSYAFMEITAKSANQLKDISQFKLDYTFWLNVVAIGLVGWLNYSWRRRNQESAMKMSGEIIKKTVAGVALGALGTGIIIHLFLAAH